LIMIKFWNKLHILDSLRVIYLLTTMTKTINFLDSKMCGTIRPTLREQTNKNRYQIKIV
jgi:hypothetical protein